MSRKKQEPECFELDEIGVENKESKSSDDDEAIDTTLDDPDSNQDATALERFLFHTSWMAATFGGCLTGMRDPHNKIYQDNEKNLSLTLGSILLDNSENIKIGHNLKKLTLQDFVATHHSRPLFVIQVLKNFELITPLFGTGLKAIASERDPSDKINVQVRRLVLIDFSSDMKPTDEFLNEFRYIYDELKTKTDINIYVHCKAGVNRSFRVSAGLYTLFELGKIKTSLSLDMIIDQVAQVCANIRAERPYIDLHVRNYLKQISFISHLVLKGLEMSNDVTDEKMTLLIKASMKTVLLPQFFETYVEERASKGNHTSLSGRLFKSFACSKEHKLSAAQKFKDDLAGKKIAPYTSHDLTALNDGTLKDLVRWTRKTVGLPLNYHLTIAARDQEHVKKSALRHHK